MKKIAFVLIMSSMLLSAATVPSPNIFKSWPSLSLQTEFIPMEKDLVEFETADFDEIERNAVKGHIPMIPISRTKQFSEMVSLKNPDIKWRVFMTATAGSHVSGFSQGFGMTTMLIEDELFLDAEVEHLQYNYKNKWSKYYGDGDKYRVNTTLHWYPTDNFSMHIGLGGLVDK